LMDARHYEPACRQAGGAKWLMPSLRGERSDEATKQLRYIFNKFIL
jgi:hypothetical protein